jgi:NodT family efflux transporter outer membrane factor (OMF) lipoprotein
MKRTIRQWPLRAALTTALVVLSGCMVGPNYRPIAPALPTAFPSQADLDSRPAMKTAPALESWWTGFDDPELISIIDRVLAQNLELSAAAERVTQARAAAQQAGAQRYPEAHLEGSVAAQHQSLQSPIGKIASAFPGYERDQALRDIDAGASWELDLFGALKRGAQAASADAQAAEALQQWIRVSVAAEAADAYFRLRGLHERIELTQAQIDTDDALLQLVGRRQDAGVATDLEIAQARALLSHARAALPPLRSAVALQSNRLDVLMGVPAGTYAGELRSAAAEYRIPAIDTAEGPAQLLRRRPDVIAAERRLAASSARIGVAVAEYYPRVSLSALLGFESLNGGALIQSASFQPAAIAGLRWHLFDFGRIDAQVAQARGANLEALANYRQSMLSATADVEDAIAQVTQTEAQFAELQDEVNANLRAREAAQQQYVAGTVSLLDVLDADRQLLAARDSLAQAHADDARAAVAAFRALGGGWTPPKRSAGLAHP